MRWLLPILILVALVTLMTSWGASPERTRRGGSMMLAAIAGILLLAILWGLVLNRTL